MSDSTKSPSLPTAQALSSPSPEGSTSPPTETARKSTNPFDNDTLEEAQREHASSVPPSVNASTRPVSQSPSAQDTRDNTPVDPAISELKAIFPDFDEVILQSVLESAGGNQAAAIEILLGMSDPNYKSEAPPPQAQPMTQEELDEELARRLMLEEQEEQQLRWNQRNTLAPQRRNSRHDQGDGSQQPAQTAGSASGDKDTMAEIQEHITKVAEAGKKTFGNIFTKVKAKIQEFERGGSSSTAPSAQWEGGYDPQGYPHQTQYPQYHHGAPPQQQASYYDPNSPITLSPSQSLPQGTPASVVQGYGATPNPVPSRDGPNTVAGTPSTGAQVPVTQATSSSPPVPPSNPAPTPIDGGKLGLLPKRPVSLIRDPPAGQQSTRRGDSDDDLEYAENPFEDQKK